MDVKLDDNIKFLYNKIHYKLKFHNYLSEQFNVPLNKIKHWFIIKVPKGLETQIIAIMQNVIKNQQIHF